MTRYVQQVIQPGEIVAYQSTIHWVVYAPAVIFGVIGIAGLAVLAAAADNLRPLAYGLMGFGGLFSLLGFARAWFARWTTEIAATNRRIIYKRGFISRQTIEMNMDKVESIDVNQSVMGRLFDYGDILVRGTGSGLELLRKIEHPIAFRNAVIAR